MRAAFAHDAVLLLSADGDERAPGGAITRALCGAPSHQPPCPLAPHHTDVVRSSRQLILRILFACEPEAEPRVRRLVEEALAGGREDHPDGGRTHWTVVRTGASAVRSDERDHADRLTRN